MSFIPAIFSFNSYNRDKWVGKEISKIPSGQSVLDVAAGTCPYKHLFKNHIYKAQDFVQLAPDQHRGGHGYGDIDYICDAAHIPVPDQSFDVVICTEALEHVPEPIKIISEIARIVKSRGKIILTAPLGSGLHQEPYHYYGGYTPHWYKHFLTQYGFSEVNITSNASSLMHFGQQAYGFIKMTIPWKLQTSYLVKFSWFPLWSILVIPVGFMIPIVCYFINGLDQEKKFTVGYFVTAVKN